MDGIHTSSTEATKEERDRLLRAVAHRKRKYETALQEVERPVDAIALCMARKRAKINAKREEIHRLEREIDRLASEQRQALDECVSKRSAHARASDLWRQIEDLLGSADGSQTCVPIGCRYEVEPLLARMADACPRDKEDDLVELRGDDLVLANAVVDSLRKRDVTVTKATITVVMETPVFHDYEHDLNDPCFSFKDIEDSTPYEMMKWMATDADGECVLAGARIVQDDEDGLAACAASGISYSRRNLRGDSVAPYLKSKVDVAAWVVCVPPLA